MLELRETRAGVVLCCASADALDAIRAGRDAAVCRTAPDEALVVVPPQAAGRLLAGATGALARADPDAVVLDATDGWCVWTLTGAEGREAFARLSTLLLPAEGFAQGPVAHVPAKVLATPRGLHMLVPAMWREHLRERILAYCADLGVAERTEPRAWTGPVDTARAPT